jgi:hypothetical protein
MTEKSICNVTILELRQYVRTQLGGSELDIELSDGDIDTCAGDALREFHRVHPMIGVSTLSSVSADQKQIIQGGRGRVTRFWVDHKGIADVYDVHFLRKLQFTDFIGIENPFYLDAVMRAFQGGTSGDYLSDLTYLEQAKKIFSSHPEWNAEWLYDSERKCKRLSLFIDVSSLGVSFEYYDICYFFFYKLEASDSPENGIGTLPSEYEQWFRDYTVARSMQILGRKLRKFGGIPSPFGGTIVTDGEALRAEGKEDELRLREDAKSFRRPLPILTE